MSKNVWHGNKQDGIQLCYKEQVDTGNYKLDEIFQHVNGKCVLHIERMDDKNFFVGIYAKNHTARVHVQNLIVSEVDEEPNE